MENINTNNISPPNIKCIRGLRNIIKSKMNKEQANINNYNNEFNPNNNTNLINNNNNDNFYVNNLIIKKAQILLLLLIIIIIYLI